MSKFNRRSFISSILGVGGIAAAGSIFYPGLSNLNSSEKVRESKVSIKAGNITEFEINSARIIEFRKTPLILIRKEDGKFAALAAICTHVGCNCIVQYRKDVKQIICASDKEVYDLKGRNISGISSKPLDEYSVQVINDEVVITT